MPLDWVVIDLHNHILPGLDDGAADLSESLAIAERFVAEGVTRVAATPHFNPLGKTGVSAAEVRDRVVVLRDALRSAGIPLEVEPGSEVFLAPEVPDLVAAGDVATLGASRAVLVELPFEGRPLYAEQTLAALLFAGYRPVLAHPERSGWLQRDQDAVEDMLRRGVVLQLTAASLSGYYGPSVRRAAEGLLRRGAYATAASDRHHPEQPRSLADLHAAISSAAGDETADLLLTENPGRLLADEPVERPAPVEQRSLRARLFGG